MLDTITKFGFKGTNDTTKSLNNICYMNDTCTEISKQVRKKLGRTLEYDKGENLICREWFKYNDKTFNVNFELKVKKQYSICQYHSRL